MMASVPQWLTAGAGILQLVALIYYAGRYAERLQNIGDSLKQLSNRVLRLENRMMTGEVSRD